MQKREVYPSPRETRSLIQDGRLVMDRVKPAPPPEWRKYRRDRMQVAINAAWLFLKGEKLDDIIPRLQMGGISRARAQQYVVRGLVFLWERRALRPAAKFAGM